MSANHDDDEVSTVLRARFDPSEVDDSSFELRVVEGPDAGKALVIDAASPTPVYVGKSPACDLVLTDREVSRRHASFELVGKRLHLVDHASKNGTFVDNTSITGAHLVGGELLRLGATVLRATRSTAKTTPLPVAAKFGKTIGASTEMRRLYPLCARLAAADVPVVIEGETGTGKEVLAESLHDMSPRAQGPFVVFDCTAVPPNLVESELFGHERGAFTGAITARKGVFEQAHGGTLLIDEIGDLDLALQPKLLRAIERSEIRRVGGDRSIRVNVRILSATRRDLDREVQKGRFRDDLFHRLAVTRIELPALRSRRGDIPLLTRHFARELGGDPAAFPGNLLARWEDLPWPGNVRELRNAIARRIALGDVEPAPLEREASSLDVPSAGQSDFLEQVLTLDLALATARQRVVDEFEQRYIERILAKHGGNVSHAAQASGIARRHFQRLKARSGR